MAKKSLNGDRILGALADLSEAVGGGFEKVHKEFAEVTDRFEKVDHRLVESDGRFDRVDHQLTAIRGQLDRIETIILKDHERRLEALERKASASHR